MTTNHVTWEVSVDGGTVTVRGFQFAGAAQRHVNDHFFNKKECWGQLATGSDSPETFRPLPKKHSPEWFSTINEAETPYVAATKRCTTSAKLSSRRPNGDFFVVSQQFGVFAVFRREVSDLKTAYRPLIGAVRGKPTIRDFARSAREKFLRKTR